MGHVDALSKRHFQQLVPVFDRLEYDMHIEFARVIGDSFKFEKLELYGKWRVLHFKCAGWMKN